MKQIIFTCSQVPIMQNRVYDSEESAERAPTGDLEICFKDGFGWNGRFDQNLMKYDDQYDNSVPSSSFNAYYDRIADYLVSCHDITSGPIVDIGCGKGTFLKRMAERYEFKGIGIDPSYEGPDTIGNLKFIAEEFNEHHIEFAPSLVLCRHTLEHIPDPISFLTSILSAFPNNAGIPVFVEVPDLDWIIAQKSWWDFCYEHVNYFSAESLRRCLQLAGCSAVKVTPEFDGQYLWGEGVVSSDVIAPMTTPLRLPAINDMNVYITEVMKKIEELSLSRKLVIWGMATKGVMYALHARRQGVHVSYGVDINTKKQGKYAPISGLRICAPEDLPSHENYAVVCMNPIYMSEIREHLERMNLNFVLLEP